jgi:hypothetical protein
MQKCSMSGVWTKTTPTDYCEKSDTGQFHFIVPPSSSTPKSQTALSPGFKDSWFSRYLSGVEFGTGHHEDYCEKSDERQFHFFAVESHSSWMAQSAARPAVNR